MAKKNIEEKKHDCLIDYKTGHYSQRQLSKKHKISLGLVNKITKGVPKDLEQAVAASVNAVSSLDEQSLNAVQTVAYEKIKHLKFIHNATLKNISVLMKKVDEDMTPQEHKYTQDVLAGAGNTLGVIDNSKQSINVTAQAGVQVNESKHAEYIIVDE